jgi:DNA polymerase-3 subunit delta
MHGLENLELADVEAISADASNVAIDRVIRAAFSGNVTELDDSIKRLSAGGADGGVLLGGALREAINLNLHTTSHGQYGASPGVQRGYRHFNRISIDQHSANRWTSTKARQAIEIVAAASAHARRNADLALELAGRALWSIAYIARG